jgi:hypothetical protein
VSLFAVLLLVLHGYNEYFHVKIKTLLRFFYSHGCFIPFADLPRQNVCEIRILHVLRSLEEHS